MPKSTAEDDGLVRRETAPPEPPSHSRNSPPAMTSELIYLIVPVAILTTILVVVWRRVGPFAGVGCATVASFLFPTWVDITALGIEWDVRLATALISGAAALFLRPKWMFDRLSALDAMVLFICVWQVICEWKANGPSPGPIFQSYGFWMLPYVIGRCSVRTERDLSALAIAVAVVSTIFGAVAFLECLASFDIYAMIFGDRPGMEFRPKRILRWGHFRAEGPFDHPIFFGIVLTLLLPWCVWLLSLGRDRRKKTGLVGTIGNVVGNLSTISRGPILAMALGAVVTGVTRNWKLAAATLVLIVGSVATVMLNPSLLVLASRWIAELTGERVELVVVDGKEQVSSSVLGRLVQAKAYGPAMQKGGMFGYGMTATSTFPPDIPEVPVDTLTGEQIPIVDNCYVLLTLRGGWVLGIAYFLLHVVALYQLVQAVRWGEDAWLSRLLAGAVVAHAFVSATVYSAYDYFFVFLWTIGLCGIHLSPDDPREMAYRR